MFGMTVSMEEGTNWGIKIGLGEVLRVELGLETTHLCCVQSSEFYEGFFFLAMWSRSSIINLLIYFITFVYQYDFFL